MDYKIKLATAKHIPELFALVKELAIYENAGDEVSCTLEEYQNRFEEGLFEAIVAVDALEEKVVGMALYYDTFSTWKGKMIYLEDFVITKDLRKSGIGQLIFDEFLRISKQKGAKLVKWQVLDWNVPAIKFYEKNKAVIEKEWYNGKIFL